MNPRAELGILKNKDWLRVRRRPLAQDTLASYFRVLGSSEEQGAVRSSVLQGESIWNAMLPPLLKSNLAIRLLNGGQRCHVALAPLRQWETLAARLAALLVLSPNAKGEPEWMRFNANSAPSLIRCMTLAT